MNYDANNRRKKKLNPLKSHFEYDDGNVKGKKLL